MQARYKEFSFGWRIVLSSALGIGLGMAPLPFYTLGVFAGPLSQEFGWGVDKIFIALLVTTLCSLLLSPVIGLIVDRVGARKVVVPSVLTFGLALMLHALNPGSFALYIAIWVVIGVVGVGTLPITWTRVINNWFSECRGLALGLALVSTGITGVCAKFWVAYLIGEFGWRWAFVGLGLFPLLIALPVVYLLFRDTDDPTLSQDVLPHSKREGAVAVEVTGMSAPQAFRDWRFWLLGICFVAVSFGIGGTLPNLETLFGSKGFSTSDAVTLASLVGVSVVAGRLGGGFLIDYFWAPAVAFVLLILPAISCFLLAGASLNFAIAACAVLLVGLAAGAEQDLMAFLVVRYYGMKSYGVIYGILYSAFALGAGIGPWVFATIFESTGTYDDVLRYAGVAFILGAIPLLMLGKYRDFEPAPKLDVGATSNDVDA
ncbi:MAG: MFS transporter [Pseudomonadales bacterium]